jgi:phosphohistidine phosphatase
MRHLHLLRHAKSSWDDPALSDHDRPLAPRGRRAAERIASHLRLEGIVPELVLCSSATRARETLEGIEPALGDGPDVQIERGLYGVPERELLDRLHAVPDTIDSVMLIGHNPSVQDLAVTLARPGAALDTVELKYPTGALATLVFDGSWRELAPGTAELRSFVRPKDLAD